jgi:hypothetical protein
MRGRCWVEPTSPAAGRDTVLHWLQNPAAIPRHLLLAIPAGADTVVRYAWHINTGSKWEYYLTGAGQFYGWGSPRQAGAPAPYVGQVPRRKA